MSDPGRVAELALKKNWGKFGSILKNCTFKSVAGSVYQPGSGTITTEVISETPNVKILFDEFGFTDFQSPEGQEDNTTILKIDKKAIFPASLIPDVPKVNDLIVEDGGQIWQVKAGSKDSKPLIYQLHVRPVNAG